LIYFSLNVLQYIAKIQDVLSVTRSIATVRIDYPGITPAKRNPKILRNVCSADVETLGDLGQNRKEETVLFFAYFCQGYNTSLKSFQL